MVIGCNKSPTDPNGNGVWEQIYETKSTGMYVDQSGDILLATVDGTGITPVVARSLNNGNTWSTILSDHETPYLTMSPSGDIYTSHLYSLDNGVTWEEMTGVPLPIRSMGFTSSGDVFAAITRIGLFRSHDKGASWENAGFSNNSNNRVFVNVDQKDRIVVGFMDGICYSTDNGGTWSDTTLNERVVSLAVNSSGHVFAGYTTGNFLHGLAISTDNGATWTFQEIKDEENVTVYPNQIVIGPHNEILLCNWTRIFLSEDDGNTWRIIGEGIANKTGRDFPHYTGMGISPNGHVFVSAHSGVWRSIDPLEGY